MVELNVSNALVGKFVSDFLEVIHRSWTRGSITTLFSNFVRVSFFSFWLVEIIKFLFCGARVSSFIFIWFSSGDLAH